MTGQNLQAHTAASELMYGIDQMPKVPPESIQLPYHQRVFRAKGLEAVRQPRAVFTLAGGLIFIEMRRVAPASISASRWRWVA